MVKLLTPRVPTELSRCVNATVQLRTRRLTMSADTWALLAIATVVALANLPYLLGLFDPNPLDLRSGLNSVITPGLLGGKPVIDPSYGFTSQAIGHLAALDLLHLRLPWWNHYEGTGMPLLGEAQGAALFPLTLLSAFPNGQLYEHVLLELVAGVCTYRLLRRLELNRAAAVAGGIAFALNGKFAWFADATVNPLPFLPMALLGIERALAATRTGRRGGWRLLAVAGALSVYAGFPEVTYVDTLLVVCWAGWRCGCLERAQLGSFVAKVALGAVAGTLLAAPMLVAMGSDFSHADLGVHAGTQLAGSHIPLSGLPQLLMPYVYGQLNADPNAATWISVGGYVSTTLVLLAVVGVLARGRVGLKLVLLGWGLLVFARMYGQPPGLGHVIGVLPYMSKIEFYRYATAALELPVIVLAALGLDHLTRPAAHRVRLLAAATAIIAVVIAAALYAGPVVHSLGSSFQHGTYLRASTLWGTLIVAATAAAALVRRPRVRAGVLVLFVVLDSLVLFVVPELSAPRATSLDLAPVAYLRKHLGEERFFSLGPISPNYGSYFGLDSFGVEDFPPEPYARYVRTRLDPGIVFAGFRTPGEPSPRWELMHHLAGYRFAGVQYVLTSVQRPVPKRSRGLRLVFRSRTTLIYRLATASPYFSAAGCRTSSGSDDSATAVCPRSTTLVRRETWSPGWSAEVDGHSVTVRRGDGAFQAVAIPAGSHHVTFSFTPPGMGWAGLGLLAGCALTLTPMMRRVRSLGPGGTLVRGSRPSDQQPGRA